MFANTPVSHLILILTLPDPSPPYPKSHQINLRIFLVIQVYISVDLLLNTGFFLSTCSTKLHDKLIAHKNLFYQFRGIILCNAKFPKFQQNKKQERKGTVN